MCPLDWFVFRYLCEVGDAEVSDIDTALMETDDEDFRKDGDYFMTKWSAVNIKKRISSTLESLGIRGDVTLIKEVFRLELF